MREKIEKTASDLEIDLPELLARKVVDTTINEVIFRIKDNEDEQKSILWKNFVDELKEYNELERIHKTDTKFKSKYGKSIVGFDLWEGHPIIWFGDLNEENNAIRINGMKQFAILTTRTYATINSGTPILRNKLIITNKNISYMFLGGFGVSPKQANKINKDKQLLKDKKEGWIPFQWCNLQIPEYIKEQFRVGTFNHDYGVLPAMEMLNKDIIDIDSYTFDPKFPNRDIFYSDWYPASDIIDLFNGFLQFFAGELVLDHTRIIGTFSQQDINNLIGKNKSNQTKDIKEAFSRIKETDSETSALKQKLILKSLGGEGSQLEKMQTTLKGLEYTQTLDQIITLFFKISGYSWDTDSSKVYENVSQTMNSSRGVYESTKEKITLFERQWKDFYSKIAFAWFKQQGQPFANLDEARQEFEKMIDFKIVSNVLQQENNNYQRVVELKMNNLISTHKAIKDLNPDLSKKEVEEEVDRIEEEGNKFKQQFDNFGNMDFMGYEENENPARDNNGWKEGDK